jgi:hypothetical protein
MAETAQALGLGMFILDLGAELIDVLKKMLLKGANNQI